MPAEFLAHAQAGHLFASLSWTEEPAAEATAFEPLRTRGSEVCLAQRTARAEYAWRSYRRVRLSVVAVLGLGVIAGVVSRPVKQPPPSPWWGTTGSSTCSLYDNHALHHALDVSKSNGEVVSATTDPPLVLVIVPNTLRYCVIPGGTV